MNVEYLGKFWLRKTQPIIIKKTYTYVFLRRKPEATPPGGVKPVFVSLPIASDIKFIELCLNYVSRKKSSALMDSQIFAPLN